PMRGKEDADDYRYFHDPDLPPLAVSETDIDAVRAALPELPDARRRRYIESLGLPESDATQLCADKHIADYFEATLAALPGQAKLCANWVLGELAAALNVENLPIEASRVDAPALARLLERVREGAISGKTAKDVFAAMWAGEGDADAIIAARGLKQISDSGALAAAVDAVIAEFPEQLADYRAGNDKLLQFFVGQAMKRLRGQGNPQQLNALIRERLSSR
ncbi:MAG TPA: Asp-tRNA(Asn)/Glu-tRNA(Gln) amidotransferase GatCAB subunit B, partial [Rudaea sp.]|nr:Asp-tRNA(Asn)/Glu-tRNA(Gln) amidotransferase GatCAB subunit B [Rudaea sp.]